MQVSVAGIQLNVWQSLHMPVSTLAARMQKEDANKVGTDWCHGTARDSLESHVMSDTCVSCAVSTETTQKMHALHA